MKNINLFFLIMSKNESKHLKYEKQYKKNTKYWGIGIENEIYLEFENENLISKQRLLSNRKKERYSVDYYSNYKKECLNNALQQFILKNDLYINIPILLNSHSFIYTDMLNNAKTLYTKLTEPNPNFIGKTLIKTLEEDNKYFINNNSWSFDGDTIEFITNNFFNTNLQDVIEELTNIKTDFITEINSSFKKLNIFSEYGNLSVMKTNNPFAIHMTNLTNISMFNNGTLHYNITLPTILDNNGLIKNFEKFKSDHKKAIKIIQWLEPLLIAVYGSPDPFSSLSPKFSKASQRCAISRYIGIGTYNTDEMKTGKILSVPINELICNQLNSWWFHNFYENNGYAKLNKIGLDINFNKHYNHGIELRFFDHISDNKNIFESFEFIIYLMDYILENDDTINNPIIDKLWNQIVLKTIINGKDNVLSNNEKKIYENMFNIKLKKTNIVDIYYELYDTLLLKFNILVKTAEEDTFVLVPNGKFSLYSLKSYTKQIKLTDTTGVNIVTNEIDNNEIVNVVNKVYNEIDNNEIDNLVNKVNNEIVYNEIVKIINNDEVEIVDNSYCCYFYRKNFSNK